MQHARSLGFLAAISLVACHDDGANGAGESSSGSSSSSSSSSSGETPSTSVATSLEGSTSNPSTTDPADGSSTSESSGEGTTGPGPLQDCEGPLGVAATATLARSAIGTGDMNMTAMDVNAAGETVVFGRVNGPATIGDVALPGTVTTQGFAAKYDSELQLIWARQLPVKGNDVQFDPAGDIIIATDQELQRLDGATGDEIWSVEAFPFPIAVLSDGDVVMASREVSEDDKIVRYDSADGSVVWQTTLAPDPGLALPDAIVATDDDGIFWFGGGYGTIATQSGDLEAAGLVTVRLDSDGVALWGRALDFTYESLPDFAIDDCGLYLGGESSAIGSDGRGHLKAFVLRMDLAGEVLWQNEFMLEGDYSVIEAITTDEDGNVLVAGNGGTATLAGQPLDFESGYVAALDREGEFLWGQVLGGPTTPAVGVGYLPDGSVRVSAWDEGSMVEVGDQTILAETGIATVDLALTR